MKLNLFLRLTLFVLLIPLVNLAADRTDGPVNFIKSPAAMATGGLFSADLDNYINPAYYTDVEMEKEFIFVFFDQSYLGTFGYSRYFGNLYLAAYYSGNLFQGYYTPDYQKYEFISMDSSSTKLLKFLVSGKPSINDSGTYNNNRYALFIGTGNMGFRLSYASTLGKFSDNNITYMTGGIQSYAKSFKTALGWVIPEIQWGLTNPLTERGIQPTASLNLAFFRNYEQFESYHALDFAVEDEVVSYSKNFIQPSLTLSLGGYTFFSKPGFFSNVDLDYTLNFKIYRNNYHYLDISGKNKIRSVKGLNNAGSLSQNSFIENSFNPSIGLTYNGMNKIDLKASLFLPFAFASFKETEMILDVGSAEGKLIKNGSDTSFSYFQFTPKIVFGFQYQASPGRLDINVGGIIQFASILKANSSTDTFISGIIDPGTSMIKTKMTLYGEDYLFGETLGTNQRAALNVGLTFRFNEYMILDTMTGINSSNTVNVFGTGAGSLTSYSSILLCLKI